MYNSPSQAQNLYGAHQSDGNYQQQQHHQPPPQQMTQTYTGGQGGYGQQGQYDSHRFSQAYAPAQPTHAPPPMHQVYPSQPGIPAPAPQQAYQQPAPQLYPPAHHHQQQQQGQYEQKGVPQPIHQQPQGTPGMKLPGGSKNPLNKPVNAMGKREWSYGLFDCFDECGTCMMASFLPCFLYGQTRTKLEHMQRNNRPDPAGGSMCTGGCCLFYCLAPCYGAQIMLYMERNELVSRYGIEPSGTDCLVAFCCSCCAQIQHSREIEAEERSYV